MRVPICSSRLRLRLITKRDRFMHNSWFHNVDKLKRRGERVSRASVYRTLTLLCDATGLIIYFMIAKTVLGI